MQDEYFIYAEKYKRLEISFQELNRIIPIEYFNKFCNTEIVVYKEDVENLLISYQNKIITKDNLINWVNIIWFSELFCYEESHCDSIAGVMNELEEADERDDVLTQNNINKYLNALNKNIEIE